VRSSGDNDPAPASPEAEADQGRIGGLNASEGSLKPRDYETAKRADRP
jgi:hypothetical protein